MNLKNLPLIKQVYKYHKILTQLEVRITKIEDNLNFLEEHPDLARKKESYKRAISQRHTAWYGHFEKAVNISNILEPKITVDLGVDCAYSTFAFAFLNTGEVYGLDSFEGDDHAGYKNTYSYVLDLYDKLKRDFKVENVHFLKGYFDDIARDWDKPIDLLHIDGLHTYNAVKNDFNTWKKFFHKDTVVLFHDTVSFKDDVGKFFNELDGYKYNFTDWNGLGLWTMNEIFFRQFKYIYSPYGF
jgi:hypothetical protein